MERISRFCERSNSFFIRRKTSWTIILTVTIIYSCCPRTTTALPNYHAIYGGYDGNIIINANGPDGGTLIARRIFYCNCFPHSVSTCGGNCYSD